MRDDRLLAEIAQKIIKDREERYALFPSDIFDEYAWNMLLHLFVALSEGRVLSEDRLIGLANTSKAIGQKWLYYLAKDRQIKDRFVGDDVELTPDALAKLRKYLADAHVC